MSASMVVLAGLVSVQYALIGLYVVPRLARLADEPGPLVRTAQWGAGAFFVGCGMTHLGIAIHEVLEPAEGPTGHLLLVHVGPHLAQVIGGGVFIWIAARRMDVRFTAKDMAAFDLERARSAEALRQAEERFRIAFRNAPIGIALIALDLEHQDRLTDANPALAKITGYAPHELLNRSLPSLLHADDRASASEVLRKLVRGEGPLTIEARGVHCAGHQYWLSVQAALVRDGDGTPLYTLAQFQDITDRRIHQGNLEHIADHDSLTGLYNRRGLEAQLERAVRVAGRYKRPGALLMLDLDKFKEVNDTFGHAVGDDVIAAVAHTLRDRLRETDVIARLGGDEFAIVLAEVDADQARDVAADVLEAIRAKRVVTVGNQRVAVSASVGISAIEPWNPQTGAQLLAGADFAMYAAKELGTSRAVLATQDDAVHPQLRRGSSWASRIGDALQEKNFVLFEQPIVSLASGRFERSELLLRMRGPGGELVEPGRFLDDAERFGHVQAIDSWVVCEAIALLAKRQRAGWDHHLEVNLSAASLADERVIEHIASMVGQADIDPAKLVFEITETAAIVDVERARRFASRLAGLGCQLALDDFGAEFGSFAQLKQLPFDCVKIDGELITNLSSNPSNQLTVQAIVGIARSLGKETTAEFVADERTMDLLHDYGVDHAQGYHVGRPGPIVALCPT